MAEAEKEAGISQKSRADRVAAFRWQKGVSGNPSGRPPSPATVSDALRARLSEQYPGDRKHRTYAEKLAARLIESALRGSVSAMALVLDRVEGRAVQALTGPNGSPLIPMTVTYEGMTHAIYGLMEEIVGKDAMEEALNSLKREKESQPSEGGDVSCTSI
jgi:hypothetical protein